MPVNPNNFDYKFFEDFIREVIAENSLKNAKVTFNDDDGSGNGYLGIIRKFEIEGIKDGEHMVLPMVGKAITFNLDKREKLSLETLATRELYMYELVFPEFDKLFKEIDFNVNINRPKCYKASAKKFEEVIIMEDLAAKEYLQCKIGASLDFEHSVLALEQMAALHAVSFVHKQKYPKKLEKLCGEMTDVLFTQGTYIMKTMAEAVNYAEVHACCHESEEIMKAYRKSDIVKRNLFLRDGRNDEYSVLCHGDFWANNFLYRYQNEVPISVMLLDWQCIRYSSPVIDLFFFMFIAVNGDLRRDRFQDLINIYYEALKAYIAALGGDPNILYPDKVFRNHLEKYSYAGFTSAMIMLPVFTSSDVVPPCQEDFVESFLYNGDALAKIRPCPMYLKQMIRTIKDIKCHNLHCLW